MSVTDDAIESDRTGQPQAIPADYVNGGTFSNVPPEVIQ